MRKPGKKYDNKKICPTIPGIIGFWLLFIFFANVVPISAQEKWQKKPFRTDPAVCFASKETGHSFIHPPAEFLNRLKSGKKSGNIVLSFVNTPDSVKPSIEYAAEIWDYLISSSVPIYMQVTWKALSGSTLGSCGATVFYDNFEGAPMTDTYYPIAVVEKITNKEITGSGDPDMEASFNSIIPWYFGTDGNTPPTKYDLVSTVLHEIAHGLGFTGFFKVNSSQRTASYGFDDELPAIFDRYVENNNQNRLTDVTYFSNSSASLYKAITSNQLYSGSPVAYIWGNQNRPRLYAPITYSSGSSIYHLNDATYPYGDINSLMTSATGKGEAIHSPGPLTKGILADIGWKYLYLKYTPLKDMEEATQPIEFNVSVTSDLGIKNSSFYLVYSYSNISLNADSVLFKTTGNTTDFVASLTPRFAKETIKYYITVSDTLGRKYTAPSFAPDSLYYITIGPDSIKPVITHQPVKYILSSSKTFTIAATVTDNLGVDSVRVIFYKTDKTEISETLVKGEGDLYTRKFDLHELGLENTDSVHYSIEAVDLANAKNKSRLPVTGEYSFKVEEIKNPVREYSNNFDSVKTDFILSDFTINKESGFDSYALNSPHPYPSPEKDNDSLNFITILRYLIILTNNGPMSYDEVVLVEPGEDGAVFGSSNFYDYVIVEGSKNQGNSWLPLLDGYDSGSQTSWETAYNQNIVGENSLTAGTRNLFVNRVINMTQNGNFKGGDTLLIRFRLYSDPYAHGWGWAIDNLNIQNKLTSVEKTAFSPGNITVWPNPAGNHLNLLADNNGIIGELDIDLYDITGRILLHESRINQLPGQIITLNLEKIPQGLFLITVRADKKLVFTQKMIKTTF